MKNEALAIVSKDLGLAVNSDHAQSRQLLINRINELLAGDFEKMISILYRMDINEMKLKLLLKDNPGHDAGPIIADLMIERQAEKIKSRKETKPGTDIPDNERW
ncbi:MAG: hypothetical protein ABI688_09475 [Bacteroidota bacterium]